MGRHKNPNKRKNSSDGTSAQSKNARNGGSPVNNSVSDSISQANSVLYGDDSTLDIDNSVFETSLSSLQDGSMSDSGDKVVGGTSAGGDSSDSPSNSDILKYLKRMDSKISVMDSKLNKLDLLEQKVSGFDSELKKLWTFVHDQFKDSKDVMSKISDRIDTLEFSLGIAQEQITQLTSDKAKVNDSLLYVQSQSMRNNLIFTGITEDPREKPEDTESKLRQFMVEKLKLAQDIVDGFRLERVHRMGDNSARAGASNKPRNIVAKFLQFKDREIVRRARSNLKGTGFFINEQFPKEIADRRKLLLPKMRQAIRDGKSAWISYDTLYIDGRPIRNEPH
ncbi:MAG: hypothetical protein AB2693_27090 [Candidatus Thiodiazotropha sp.]